MQRHTGENMTDRELLEAAAIAACLEYECTSHTWDQQHDQHQIRAESGQLVNWNPLADDGDALRLAVKLNMHIFRIDAITTARLITANWGCDERDDGDPVAATRRAIVRVAARVASRITPL
jgi:hypothetical protein